MGPNAEAKTMQFTMRHEDQLRFAIEAVVMVAVLFAVSRLAPTMPAWALAVVWAAFSFASMLGIAYHDVINKTYRQTRFMKGGRLGRFNAGRTFCLIVAFVASAVCMASLLVSSVRWDGPMWVAVVLAIPVYLAVSLLVGRLMRKEVQPLYRASFVAIWSAVVVGVVLCIVYAVAMYAQPVETFGRAADAFVATPRPFDSSPSAIMREAGTYEALAEGLSTYALSKAAEQSFEGYIVVRLLLNAGAFLALAALLSVCSIDPHELGRVFTELEDPENRGAHRAVQKRFVALAAVLPIVLVAGFIAAEANFGQLAKTDEYTWAQRFVAQQVDFVVVAFDGKHYDPESVEALVAKAGEKSRALSREAKDHLVSLVNASFDKRVENVDAYLDWYYRIFGDWEQLVEMVKGTGEQFAQEQFASRIEQGIDDTELADELNAYVEATDKLREQARRELEQYEITGDYPSWVMTEVPLEEELGERLSVALEPSPEALKARERLGISVGAGVAAGFVVKALVKKVAGKTLFKAAAERVGSIAAAGSAGSAGGPAGIAAAVIATLGVDVAMTKLDELANRESFKQEIIATIEEERADVLAAIDAQFA